MSRRAVPKANTAARCAKGTPGRLRAGAIELQWQDGRLIGLTAGGHVVWQAVMFLYRDPRWGTPRHVVDQVAVDDQGDGFMVQLQGSCPAVPALRWKTHVSGHVDGRIVYSVEAELQQDLLTSRTGICVLHPASAAGRTLEVEHVDGRVSRSQFPQHISPWQPFTQIRALRHRFAPGCWAQCRFEGDDFEMEDQRNFSDASFKTYSRSNFMPRPFRLDAGMRVRQSVTLELEQVPRRARRVVVSSVTLAIVDVPGEDGGRLPALGLQHQLDASAADALPDFWHQRHDLRQSGGLPVQGLFGVPVTWPPATAPMRVDLVMDDDQHAESACRALAHACAKAGRVVAELALFPTTARSLEHARACFPSTRVGGGTAFFFTHLNRLTLPPGLDFVTYTTCPIVHVADDLSVMQSLGTLVTQVQTLRMRGVDGPVRVGPVGIGMALDPFGVGVVGESYARLAMARDDPRDRTAFGQAWMLAYLCRMIDAGVQALTVAHAAAFRPLQALAGRPGCDVLALHNPYPDRLAVLALRMGSGYQVWAANLVTEPQQLALRLPGRSLTTTLLLAPHALVCRFFHEPEQQRTSSGAMLD